MAIFYLVAQAALAFHIYHGGGACSRASASRTQVQGVPQVLRRGFAALIFVGNSAIIVGVWTGVVS